METAGRADSTASFGSARPLDALLSLAPLFQVDAFVKAAKAGKGLAGMLGLRKSPVAHPTPGSPGSAEFSLDDLMHFTSEPIPTSLVKMSGEHASRAVKMFAGILKYQGETGEALDEPQRLEIAQKLLHQGLKRPELKDELYMQLLKQTRGNPDPAPTLKAWELFSVVAATMPPSKDFLGLVSEYIHAVAHDEGQLQPVRQLASRTWNSLKRSAKSGPRRTLPSTEELDAMFTGRKLATSVFFLDDTFEELRYDVTTSVLEAVEQVAGIIGLQNYSTFTVFECRTLAAGKAELRADVPQEVEHALLDDNKYIADILCEAKSMRSSKEGYSSKLLFKKRMFRETDESITEPMFINLSYVQAQHDYLQGHYPVVREDAAQMAALQIQSEHASALVGDDEAVMMCIEQFVTKQVLMTRPREEWRLDAGARYRSLERLSKEDARLQFLRILRSLPYGNSIFFTVRRIEDPIGLLPAKLILGVNKRGVHFFRPVPKEYLHSAELRDIMQFGSSSTAVFFKMRVAGVLHIFQFETRQGEDICMALQTHINDIMMKRYSKAKAMATGGPESKAAPSNPDALGLQQANYGAKYEEHVAQLQKSLEEAQQRVDQTQRSIHDLTYKHEQYTSELDEVTEQLRAEEAGRNALDATLQALHKELDNTRSEVQLVKAGAAVAATSSPDDDVQLAKLEKELEAVAREFEERGAALLVLEKRAEQLSREKELVDKKVQRIEKSREGEVAELTDKLTISRDTQEQLQSKDSKIAETMAELTHINALFEATREELAGFKADAAELAELREMREDVERKEKQQKAIIEHQSKRLGELGKLFTDEQLTRKRYFNQMEDMKGKLRVAVRVRGPDTGAGSTVTATDPLTLLLQTDGGEPSELGFDAVFGPDASQEDVYEEVKPMVQSAVDGFNACVVVCGQPGAGCSHSLFGTDATPGVAMRAVDTLFRIVTRDASKFTFSVACCMLELHEGTLRDALLPPALKSNPPQLLVKKNTNGVVTVAGVSTVQVASAAELKQMVGAGLSRRHAGAGLMLSVVIESTNLQTLNVFTGRLAFSHAGDTPDAMAALDAVVGPLAAGEARVPYSRSPVTTLLSDAFGGNAKTLVIVPISPDGSDADATRAALRLAEKMRGIKNSSHKTELSKEQARLRKQVDAWKEQAGLSRAEAILAELVDVADAREAAAE